MTCSSAKQYHIKASVPCVPLLTSLILNSEAQKWTITEKKNAIGWGAKSDKAGQDVDERGGLHGFFPFRNGPVPPYEATTINQRHTA